MERGWWKNGARDEDRKDLALYNSNIPLGNISIKREMAKLHGKINIRWKKTALGENPAFYEPLHVHGQARISKIDNWEYRGTGKHPLWLLVCK